MKKLTFASIMVCMLIPTLGAAWTIELSHSPTDSNSASGYGTYGECWWKPNPTLWETWAYVSVWDADVSWESGGLAAETYQQWYKRYVTGSPASTNSDCFVYSISGTVYARCEGEAANGAPGSGSCDSYGYAKAIGNAVDGYNDYVSAICDGSATESGGWSVSVHITGGGIGYSGDETYYGKTGTDDLHKEGNVDGSPAPWAKLTCRSYAEAHGSNGADGPQKGKGRATVNHVTITEL